MAPRRRAKRSNTRMDAAIDAMKPLGFSNKLVVKTVKELLNVYGEEGWPFIEEASYKVLIEAILEKDNGEETSTSKEPANTTLLTSNTLDPASDTTEALGIAKLTNETGNQASSGTLNPEASDVNLLNATSRTSNNLNLASETYEALGTANLRNESGPSHTHTPPRPDGNSTMQRRFYYGWRFSDDEEDLVELTPGPLAEELANFCLGERERKQRWDVKPEDA